MDYFYTLDLDKVKEIISNYLAIDDAKTFILNEEVSFNPLIIKNKLLLTKEAMKIINDGNTVSFDGILNIDIELDKALKDIVLTGKELIKILTFHNHCLRIKKQFEKYDDQLLIRDYTDAIVVDEQLFNDINIAIDNNGEVKNSASTLLKELYSKLNNIEKNITSKANAFISKHIDSLQEAVYFVRNNRITFLIKNIDKNKYQGYTYGTSASGLATYIEPGEFVDLDNQKLSIMDDIDTEIYRILSNFTYRVAEIANGYKNNFRSLIELSLIIAKAYYGIYNNAIIPELNNNKTIYLENIAHPLINKETVIRNTYKLEEKYQGIVISGSNTGGKTVGLKTVGLSIIMSYLGIPLLADKAYIPLFDNIFVDIDDNQSIISSLSTFSAHIININDIIISSTKDSFILIDELVSGTDPKEAQAISLAIIDKIKEIGAKFIITTHYDDIKEYSYKDESILLSSVGFDIKNLKPTYKYHENSIGSSNALDIASKFITDNNIILNAKKYLNNKNSDTNELLNKLATQINEYNILIDELNHKIVENENINKTYINKLNEFEKNNLELKEKYLKDLNEYIEDIKNKALDKLENIKDNNKEIIKEIDDLKIEEYLEDEHIFMIGDHVRIKNNEQIGIINEINGDRVILNVRNLIINTTLDNIEFVAKEIKKKDMATRKQRKTVKRELNVIGMHIDEALVLIEDYLSDVYGSNLNKIKIIHGRGTGSLRSAIREKLRKITYIKDIKDGDYYDGGNAVTIVEIKR